MKLKLQEWNDISEALNVAMNWANNLGNSQERDSAEGKKKSDAHYARAQRYDELRQKINAEGMQ